MRALVLAAGRGTRLRPLTDQVPKALVPVGSVPLLDRILTSLRDGGFTDIIVVTGHLGEQVEARYGNGERAGLRLTYRRQEQRTGSATAALAARDALGDEPFLLTWCDVLSAPVNYQVVRIAFENGDSDAAVGVNWEEDPYQGGAVYVEGGRVMRLVEKPPPGTSHTHWNNAGILALAPVVWDYLEQLQPSARGEYELPEAIGRMAEAGRVVKAVPLPALRAEVSTAADLDTLAQLAEALPGEALGG